MQNLLNSKDLLAEPRVKAAAKAMGIRLHKVEIISRCCPGHNELVMKSLAEVAFEMRDACVAKGYEGSWLMWLSQDGFPHWMACSAKQWIIAATLAYREGQSK